MIQRNLSALALLLCLSHIGYTQETEEPIKTLKGTNVIIAVDVSKSMLAEDLSDGDAAETRLQITKRSVADLITRNPDVEFGLLAFAGKPYVVSPPTLSHDYLLGPLGLGRIRCEGVVDGTAIGLAITSASYLFQSESSNTNAIILVTDGKNNTGEVSPSIAAVLAKKSNLPIHTIAIGSDGDTFMIQTPHGPVRMKTDYDEPTFIRIAETTGGSFSRAKTISELEQALSATLTKIPQKLVNQPADQKDLCFLVDLNNTDSDRATLLIKLLLKSSPPRKVSLALQKDDHIWIHTPPTSNHKAFDVTLAKINKPIPNDKKTPLQEDSILEKTSIIHFSETQSTPALLTNRRYDLFTCNPAATTLTEAADQIKEFADLK